MHDIPVKRQSNALKGVELLEWWQYSAVEGECLAEKWPTDDLQNNDRLNSGRKIVAYDEEKCGRADRYAVALSLSSMDWLFVPPSGSLSRSLYVEDVRSWSKNGSHGCPLNACFPERDQYFYPKLRMGPSYAQCF